MPMKRGTIVVLVHSVKNASPGEVAKVSSRKNNGWLRVTLQSSGKTITVRNINGQVVRQDDIKPVELLSLSPLQKIEDAAIERTNQELESFNDSDDDTVKPSPIVSMLLAKIENARANMQLKEQILVQQNELKEQTKRINELVIEKANSETQTS